MSATLFGYPARLVLTIDGRDVNVVGGLRPSATGATGIYLGAVLDTISDAIPRAD